MDHMKSLFELVASGDDNNNNNSHWTASDVEQLARDVGEPISAQEASAMLAHLTASSSGSTGRNKTVTDDKGVVLTLEDFQHFWTHSDPEIDR
jgi:hypothetical protein